MLETVEAGATDDARGSVIWLHGLGADGHDFEPIVPELGLAGHLDLRFVFPHAPVREVTINAGIAMRAWYDIVTLDRSGPQDEAGILESVDLVNEIVEREIGRGIPRERIVLAGFSQGGAIALHAALRERERYAGLMGLSTWLPLGASFDAEVARSDSSQPRDLPVFLAHGSFDPMLPLALGEHTRDVLSAAGFRPEWHSYPMAHAVCAEEIRDIRSWLVKIFGESAEPE